MSDIIEIDISEEHTNMVERAYYEYQGLLTFLSQLTTSEWKVDDETYENAMRMYIESFTEFQIVFNSIIVAYNAQAYQGKPSVDFNRRKLVIAPEAYSCSCNK